MFLHLYLIRQDYTISKSCKNQYENITIQSIKEEHCAKDKLKLLPQETQPNCKTLLTIIYFFPVQNMSFVVLIL